MKKSKKVKSGKSVVKKTLKSKIIPKEENLFSKEIFPVVGIGASAGGLAAIESFLKAIPRGNCL